MALLKGVLAVLAAIVLIGVGGGILAAISSIGMVLGVVLAVIFLVVLIASGIYEATKK